MLLLEFFIKCNATELILWLIIYKFIINTLLITV
jgi:hypothetical protein